MNNCKIYIHGYWCAICSSTLAAVSCFGLQNDFVS